SCEGRRSRVDHEVLSAVGGDGEWNLRGKLAPHVAGALPDVSQHATVILAHQTRVVGSPRRQVSRVESGCDDVIQVGEKQPPIVRQRDDSTNIVAADERRVY